MKLLILIAALISLTGCGVRADELCVDKAELAHAVAKARDRGMSMVELISKVKSTGQVGRDQKQIIAVVYSARNVSPERVQEIFLAKCF